MGSNDLQPYAPRPAKANRAVLGQRRHTAPLARGHPPRRPAATAVGAVLRVGAELRLRLTRATGGRRARRRGRRAGRRRRRGSTRGGRLRVGGPWSASGSASSGSARVPTGSGAGLAGWPPPRPARSPGRTATPSGSAAAAPVALRARAAACPSLCPPLSVTPRARRRRTRAPPPRAPPEPAVRPSPTAVARRAVDGHAPGERRRHQHAVRPAAAATARSLAARRTGTYKAAHGEPPPGAGSRESTCPTPARPQEDTRPAGHTRHQRQP